LFITPNSWNFSYLQIEAELVDVKGRGAAGVQAEKNLFSLGVAAYSLLHTAYS
jgi:hypothetical protein